MRLTTTRKSLLSGVAGIAVLVLALLLLTDTAATRADPPVRSGDTLTLPFTDRATLTITPRDAAACGGGAPCIEVTDPAVPAQPAGPCESLSADHLALRCSTAGVASVEVAGSGNLDVAMRIDRPAGSACPAYTLTLREGAAGGPVAARDGCAQRIVCTQYYVGMVDADGQDAVDASCNKVTVDGTVTRTPGAQPLCTTPYHGCVPDGGGGGRGVQTTPTVDPTDRDHDGRPDAGTETAAPEPITSVRLARAGRRAFRTTVVLPGPVRMSVSLQRRTPRGRWAYVRSVGRDGRRGRNVLTLRRPDGKPLAAGLYRVTAVAAVPASKPVVTKAVRIRR